ncbi:MAG: type II toxin-antitoxin system VapC family toxin [Microlunatus sp.]
MIVLDASAAVELLLNLPHGPRIRDRIADPATQLHAPQLLTVEILQVLRRRVAAGITTVAQAGTALSLLDDLGVSPHDHALLARRIWELRDNLTAYDAAYVALAELLGATLLTTDARLARASGNRATIDLIDA